MAERSSTVEQAMNSAAQRPDVTTPGTWPFWAGEGLLRQAFDYGIDFWQRSLLFFDILRQRGNNHFEHNRAQGPNVLTFKFEVVMNGQELPRPVNYVLVRIIPPADAQIDPRKRPFIVFDPRAGHGPGIGGMKHDSEIGVALAAGHACYFVGFLPRPVAGQTIEDVCRAEAAFIEEVISLHPAAEGKPCLIGNCQAGWQILMTSALRPELAGPILLAGAPLSYWAGVRGKNPLRYLGGLLGGTWLTSLAGDLGQGIFDGANLVANFESLNPANTYWQKRYNVFSKADTEGPRFLEFENWWGSPVLLNAEEMQFIADELFVGNRLSSGEMYTADGFQIDLRNVKSSIIVFCSFGDDITPPQQALDWILDLYDSDQQIVANGQTIVYALHQTIGHLGIFVSAKVATKEHREFTSAIDLIDVLPPGLYEAVFTRVGPDTERPELVSGDYLVRFEARTLADIRALGVNDIEDDRRFATVRRVSEINQGLYRTFLSPAVKLTANDQCAEMQRRLHPSRVRFEMFSDENPVVRPVANLAEHARAHRKRVAPDNLFLGMERQFSKQITDALRLYGDMRDRYLEGVFMAVYGSPVLQTLVGLRADATTIRRRIGRNVARDAALSGMKSALEARVAEGGVREAMVRALLYIGLGNAEPAADERSFAMLRQIRAETPECQRMTLARFKEILRQQLLLLQLDEQRALETIPHLLPVDAVERARARDILHRVTAAQGELSREASERLLRIDALFSASSAAAAVEPEWNVSAGAQALSLAPVRPATQASTEATKPADAGLPVNDEGRS